MEFFTDGIAKTLATLSTAIAVFVKMVGSRQCLAGFVAGYGRGPQFALSLAMAAGAATAASDEIADAEEILSILHEM